MINKNIHGQTFAERVKQIVANIPLGQTMSYGEVAALAGSPGAARAVGNIMKTNFDASVPCHRVVRADGTPGEYNRGAARKIELLEYEKLSALVTELRRSLLGGDR